MAAITACTAGFVTVVESKTPPDRTGEYTAIALLSLSYIACINAGSVLDFKLLGLPRAVIRRVERRAGVPEVRKLRDAVTAHHRSWWAAPCGV